jgi:hypothetical protein
MRDDDSDSSVLLLRRVIMIVARMHLELSGSVIAYVWLRTCGCTCADALFTKVVVRAVVWKKRTRYRETGVCE